jgi:uncharacterized protein YchJ
MKTVVTDDCPCGGGQTFGACCRPYLVGEAAAETAEQLMRSRYSAYHQGNIDYLIATHHPTQRYAGQRAAILQSTARTTWLGLRVLATQAGQATDSQGRCMSDRASPGKKTVGFTSTAMGYRPCGPGAAIPAGAAAAKSTKPATGAEV